jgi:hypothetical protein
MINSFPRSGGLPNKRPPVSSAQWRSSHDAFNRRPRQTEWQRLRKHGRIVMDEPTSVLGVWIVGFAAATFAASYLMGGAS